MCEESEGETDRVTKNQTQKRTKHTKTANKPNKKQPNTNKQTQKQTTNTNRHNTTDEFILFFCSNAAWVSPGQFALQSAKLKKLPECTMGH